MSLIVTSDPIIVVFLLGVVFILKVIFIRWVVFILGVVLIIIVMLVRHLHAWSVIHRSL